MAKKVVLEEEEYVEQLEQIIERDFFPELKSLKKQAGVAVDSESRRAHERPTNARASSSWDVETPLREAPTEDTTSKDGPSAPEPEAAAAGLTLTQFVASYTSEDNDSFAEIQKQDVVAHQRRHHWAFEQDPAKGDPKLHLLTDGTWISKERRLLADKACDYSKGAPDERPNAPDTWKFRAQNPLLFPPTLETSRDICQVSGNSDIKLLENGDASGNHRSGRPVRAKKEIVHANARFPAPSEATKTTRAAVTSGGSTPAMELVEMTPLIAPGIDASPLITWGDIEGTPVRIPTATDTSNATSEFSMQDTRQREEIASRLEAQARKRKAQASRRSVTPLRSPVPVVGHKRSLHELERSARTQALQARLSSVRSVGRTPFGSDSELRASYATPLLPPRHERTKTPRR